MYTWVFTWSKSYIIIPSIMCVRVCVLYEKTASKETVVCLFSSNTAVLQKLSTRSDSSWIKAGSCYSVSKGEHKKVLLSTLFCPVFCVLLRAVSRDVSFPSMRHISVTFASSPDCKWRHSAAKRVRKYFAGIFARVLISVCFQKHRWTGIRAARARRALWRSTAWPRVTPSAESSRSRWSSWKERSPRPELPSTRRWRHCTSTWNSSRVSRVRAHFCSSVWQKDGVTLSSFLPGNRKGAHAIIKENFGHIAASRPSAWTLLERC